MFVLCLSRLIIYTAYQMMQSHWGCAPSYGDNWKGWKMIRCDGQWGGLKKSQCRTSEHRGNAQDSVRPAYADYIKTTMVPGSIPRTGKTGGLQSADYNKEGQANKPALLFCSWLRTFAHYFPPLPAHKAIWCNRKVHRFYTERPTVYLWGVF